MRFEEIRDTGHPMYSLALELYKISFSPNEQRMRRSQDSILTDAGYHFALIYDGADFVGIMLSWETEEFIYIEHFCMLPEMRGRGYGERALSKIAEKGKKVILEIDPPEDDISKRRKRFYERCGFVENPYRHIHPPYRSENSGHTLTVMSFPSGITPDEYRRFDDYLKERVMKNAF